MPLEAEPPKVAVSQPDEPRLLPQETVDVPKHRIKRERADDQEDHLVVASTAAAERTAPVPPVFKRPAAVAGGDVVKAVLVPEVASDNGAADADEAAIIAKRVKADGPKAARVDALRIAGHWSDALPAMQPEPQRVGKTHWDHVLEEAVWLAKEVNNERTWKRKVQSRELLIVSRVLVQACRNVALAAKRGLEEMRKITGGSVGSALQRAAPHEEVISLPFFPLF